MAIMDEGRADSKIVGRESAMKKVLGMEKFGSTPSDSGARIHGHDGIGLLGPMPNDRAVVCGWWRSKVDPVPVWFMNSFVFSVLEENEFESGFPKIVGRPAENFP